MSDLDFCCFIEFNEMFVDHEQQSHAQMVLDSLKSNVALQCLDLHFGQCEPILVPLMDLISCNTTLRSLRLYCNVDKLTERNTLYCEFLKRLNENVCLREIIWDGDSMPLNDDIVAALCDFISNTNRITRLEISSV